MKCFEKLVLNHIKASLPPSQDPHQFAYRTNRSTEDAITIATHTAMTHLENPHSYMRMLFIDFSSAFYKIIPNILIHKLLDLGLSFFTCAWVKDFLINQPQCVRLGPHNSSSITLSSGMPQGPVLYSLYTYDCTPVLHQICWWHNSHGAHLRRRWNSIQRWDKAPRSMVFSEQPLTEHHKNQRDHHRLQEEMQRHPSPALHQWSQHGESRVLQIPGTSHLWGPLLVCQHLCHHQESTTETLLSQTAQEEWHKDEDVGVLLLATIESLLT